MTRPLQQLIPTPCGPARVVVEGLAQAGRLVLGHGAGGGIEARDLCAVRDAARARGMQVVRVEQPWRVAGRRVAQAPARLDTAWRAVLAALSADRPTGPAAPGAAVLVGPACAHPLLVVGGRSAGARVACRTAADVGASAVLALAFPLVPPGRPDRSRAPELLLPTVPRLVVQGSRDAFGVPPPAPGVQVHVVAGADHGFAVRRQDGRDAASVAAEIGAAFHAWLDGLAARPAAQTLT